MVTPRADTGARNRRRLGVVLALVIVVVLVFLVLRDNGLLPFAAEPAGRPAEPETDTALHLDGSGTIGSELAPDLAEAFLQGRGATGVRRESAGDLVTVTGTLPGAAQPIRLEINSTGSSTAFSGLLDGRTDVGMASRRITPAEQQDLAARGDLTSRESEHILALDAVTVIVNAGRDVTRLSVDQLRGIYTCAITDWSQIGSAAGTGPIRVLAFEDGSGTLDTFRERVLGDERLCPDIERIRGVEELSRAVAADRAAVGFVGLPFVGTNTAVALFDGTSVPTEPTRLTVSTESYLLTRRLYLYLPTLPVADPLARDFVEFALSEPGQRIVDTAGFVSPLFPPTPPAPPPCTAAVPEYCAFITGAERIPFDVRFSTGTDEVDNRAFRNLALFAESLAAPENRDRTVLLVGFADNAGTDDANLALSTARAAAVMRELGSDGVQAVTTGGFGEALPVDTNDTPEGREQNRRVEVWLR